MCMCSTGERVADRADHPFVCLGIPVELVRRAEELIGLGLEHIADRQPAVVSGYGRSREEDVPQMPRVADLGDSVNKSTFPFGRE